MQINIVLKVDASTDLYQSSNQFKALNVDANCNCNRHAVDNQVSNLEKNCNCQKSIATAIKIASSPGGAVQVRQKKLTFVVV